MSSEPDPGRAAERTALAWRRTALSCVVLAALVGRRHTGAAPTSDLLVIVVALLVAAVLRTAGGRAGALAVDARSRSWSRAPWILSGLLAVAAVVGACGA